MIIHPTIFPEVKLIEPKVFRDHRGFFTESYNKKQLKELGVDIEFIQDNHSLSTEKGTIRGLHYQLNPMAQSKLVRVLAGSIYDVVVDIRENSPTYGKWEGFILNEENQRQLLVPKGFAHGFCTLEEGTQVFYKVDQYYSPEHDRGIAWDDPQLKIDWPINNPILSDKDKILPLLSQAEINFEYN